MFKALTYLDSTLLQCAHKQKREIVLEWEWMIGVFALAENVKNLKNLGYFHVKLLAKFGLVFITSNLMILVLIMKIGY